MLKGRLKEIIDFATSESPYQDANKGWINNDIYLKLGDSNRSLSNRKNEVANISIFWDPINKIISLLFIIISSAAILVFIASSYNHDKINFLSRLQSPKTSISQIETSTEPPTNESFSNSKLYIESSSQVPDNATPKEKSAEVIAEVVKPKINPLQPKSNSNLL